MLSSKLKMLRNQRGYSQQQVANAVGVSRQYISKLEGDEDIMPSLDVALKMARLFDVKVETFIEDSSFIAHPRSINTIMSELDQAIKEIKLADFQKPARIPFYGAVPCGNLLISEKNDCEYMEVPDSWVQGIENPFIVRVRSDSLQEHGIYHGDYIIADPDAPLTARKMYVVQTNSQIALITITDIHNASGMGILGRAVTAFSRKQL